MLFLLAQRDCAGSTTRLVGSHYYSICDSSFTFIPHHPILSLKWACVSPRAMTPCSSNAFF